MNPRELNSYGPCLSSEEKEKLSSRVHVLHNRLHPEIHVAVAQRRKRNVLKKRDALAELLFAH